jgi:hypothetical protein
MPEAKLKSLVAALNLDAVSVDEQTEVMGTMGELIFKDVLIRCIESLSEENKVEFGKLFEHNASEEEIIAWITKHIPKADTYVTEAVETLTDDIIAVTSHK